MIMTEGEVIERAVADVLHRLEHVSPA